MASEVTSNAPLHIMLPQVLQSCLPTWSCTPKSKLSGAIAWQWLVNLREIALLGDQGEWMMGLQVLQRDPPEELVGYL